MHMICVTRRAHENRDEIVERLLIVNASTGFIRSIRGDGFWNSERKVRAVVRERAIKVFIRDKCKPLHSHRPADKSRHMANHLPGCDGKRFVCIVGENGSCASEKL